jgi:hypothetical protein
MTVTWDRKNLHNAHGYASATGALIAFPASGSGSYSYGEVRHLTGDRKGDTGHDHWALLGAPLAAVGTPDHVIKRRLHALPGSIPFASWDDLVYWARQTLGVDGWDCLSGTNYWTPVPGSTAAPCMETVRHGDARMSSYGTCAKPIKENGLCGQHAAVVRRRTEAAQERQAHKEQEDANHRIAADAVEALAKFALEGRDVPGVKASCDYDSYRSERMPGGYNGRVSLHAEDLLAILREVGWRREAMGDVG